MDNKFRFKECNKCFGDLFWDTDEWRCWQCGGVLSPSEPLEMSITIEKQSPDAINSGTEGNLMMDFSSTSPKPKTMERRRYDWFSKYREMARYLDQDLTVEEISCQTGHSIESITLMKDERDQIEAKLLDQWRGGISSVLAEALCGIT